MQKVLVERTKQGVCRISNGAEFAICLDFFWKRGPLRAQIRDIGRFGFDDF